MTGVPKDFKTILVLDDDPLFHRLIVPVLMNRGHQVLSAHTGKEAGEIVRSEHVDLAIIDGQLTDTTGIDWITRFRADGHDSLVMFVSAFWRDAQSYHKLTKELGVALVLHKPIIAAVFAAEVDILLGKTSALSRGTEEIEDTLLALRAEYARELPERLEELNHTFQQLSAQPDSEFLLSELRAFAHKLRGTAASYGFKDIGDCATRIEESILVLQKNPQLAEDVMAEMRAALQEAKGHAANASEYLQHKAPVTDRVSVDEGVEFTPLAKILVVDDDVAFLDLVEQLARQHELEVVRATNAAEALDMANIIAIDGAMIDVGLGAKEIAFRLAHDLRNIPGYSNLPLAFLSGTGHIEQFIQSDTDTSDYIYIRKPMQADALQAAVRQLIAIRQVARPKVLVVDDDVDFTRRMAFILGHEGVDVYTLNTTEDILTEMQSIAPDALLLDVMMPGVSGFDVCRMLRTMARWRDLPITFLTAYSDVDTRIACLRCGGDDYIIKPVVNEELMMRLKMQLERARRLKQRLDHDGVTGLLLRKPFMQQLSAMLSEARRQDWTVSLAIGKISAQNATADLVSDAVLSGLSGLLNRRLRPEDLKGYWADGTIMLAFRNEEPGTVIGLLKKLSEEAGGIQASGGDYPDGSLSMHFGIAQFPYDGAMLHEIVQAAFERLRNHSEAPDDKRVNA